MRYLLISPNFIAAVYLRVNWALSCGLTSLIRRQRPGFFAERRRLDFGASRELHGVCSAPPHSSLADSAVQVINGAEWRFALLALGTGLSAAIYFVCPTTIAALASV